MSAAETPAEEDQPPQPLPPPVRSLEVPMEAVPDVVVPRLELAVRVPQPSADELPMEPVPVLEPVVEAAAEPAPEPEPAFGDAEARIGASESPKAEEEETAPVPLRVPERHEAGPGALRPEAPEPAPSAVTRAVRPVPQVRPGELDQRHPIRGTLGLVVVVVFGAIAVSLAVGAAIAAVLFAVRGGVGG